VIHTQITVGTIGVTLGPCSVPGASQPLFHLNDDEMELGLGELITIVPIPFILEIRTGAWTGFVPQESERALVYLSQVYTVKLG